MVQFELVLDCCCLIPFRSFFREQLPQPLRAILAEIFDGVS